MTTMPSANPERKPTEQELVTPFGCFHAEERDVILFPSGVPGFEESRRFVLISSPEFQPLSCLQSIDEAVSFFVVDPRRVLPDYRCVLSQTDLMRLGATFDTVLLWLAIVSLDEHDNGFLNLRAPIVVNPERMLGYQVMPHNSLYPLRHPLASE
jgi:flagellar assembly factor FliW